MGKQKVDDFTVAGAVRPVAVPSPATEIEEAPPSPPSLSRLLAANAAAAAARGFGDERRVGLGAAEAGQHGLEARTGELQRALALLRSQLQQQVGQERGECSYKSPVAKGGGELRRRRPEEEGEAAAGVEDVWAAVQRLQLTAQTMRENVAGFGGKMAPMKAPMGEEMGPVPEALMPWGDNFAVLERRMNQIRKTWFKKQIALVAAFASGLMLLIWFRTSLPSRYLGYMAGALACLWILGSIPFFRGLLVISRTTKGFTCLVARLIYICLSLFVVYALCLISPVGGTFATGLPGKRRGCLHFNA